MRRFGTSPQTDGDYHIACARIQLRAGRWICANDEPCLEPVTLLLGFNWCKPQLGQALASYGLALPDQVWDDAFGAAFPEPWYLTGGTTREGDEDGGC